MKIKSYVGWNWIIVLSFGIIAIAAAYFILHAETKNLKSRIETVNNNFNRLAVNDSTLIMDIKYMQFKEDYYLKQLDRDTNLILWFIAIVIGLSGLISYTTINRRIQIFEEEFNSKFEGSLSELNQLKSDLYDIRADIEAESHTINSQLAENFYKENNYDHYVFYELLAITKSSSYYLHNIDNEIVNKATLKSIIADLECLFTRLEEMDEKPKMKKNTYLNVTSQIREIKEYEVIENISKIHTLIELNDD